MLNLFESILRTLFALIDQIIIWIINNLYVVFDQLARANVFGDFIYAVLGRIYVFLSIYMVFKLSLSMITYIVNPGQMTDKNKGFGKLITNVMISLILIVTVPSIFKEAFRLQGILLDEQVVFRLVTGTTTTDTNRKATALSTAIYQNFVYGTWRSDQDGWDSYDTTLHPPYKYSGNKWAQCRAEAGDDEYCYVQISTVTAQSDGKFKNTYKYIISHATGIFAAYVLLICCFDAATRAVKLGLLQIIAPIPILSIIDPKGDNKKLTNWASNCGKEYIGLFLRQAGLFLAIEVIRMMSSGQYNMFTKYGGGELGIMAKIFVIIGLLSFAKQFPKWIEEILGVKLSGDGFSLGKRLKNIPGTGLAKAGGALALGAAGGLAANALAGFNKKNYFLDDKDAGWKKKAAHFAGGMFRHAGSAVAGGVSAGVRGATSKDKNMFKATSSGIKGSVDARELRDKRQDVNYGFSTRQLDKIRTFAGIDTVAKGRSISLANDTVDMRRQQAQYDALAQQIAQTEGWDTLKIESVSKQRASNFAAGSAEAKYITYINQSTELSNKIIKNEKKQAIFQQEANKK